MANLIRLLPLLVLVASVVGLLVPQQDWLWPTPPNHHVVDAFVAVVPGRPRFSPTTTTTKISSPPSLTILHPHRFNGGYDPSTPLTWTPQQAAMFVMFHHGEPKYAGLQLKTAIQHWSGFDLAEFLTRLYLGQPCSSNGSNLQEQERQVMYEPQNVRSPQWKGLETREGIVALKDLLTAALAEETLQAREVARFADAFLLKEYKWPAPRRSPDENEHEVGYSNDGTTTKEGVVAFECDSFDSQGHSVALAHVLWAARQESMGTPYTWDDIVGMTTLPELEDKEAMPMQLTDFFKTLIALMPMSAADRASMVQGMALGGWEAANLSTFMAKMFPSELGDDDDERSSITNWSFLHSNNIIIDEEDYSTIEETRQKISARTAQNDMQSEFDQLVQDYWKRTEIPIKQEEVARSTG